MADTAYDKTALVLPGGKYGPSAPLLAYASDAAEARGARIVPHAWAPTQEIIERPELRAAWVRERATPLLDDLAAAGQPRPVLLAKSLGTLAAPLAAERGLAAVWLTPLLLDPDVVAGLRKATAPFLLVGGTADKHAWDGVLARELTPHVLEVEGANHGMMVPGRLAASAAVLGQVATAIEDFLDAAVWPEGPRAEGLSAQR
jgi:hypothetical protein